jgi:hypothetical protein
VILAFLYRDIMRNKLAGSAIPEICGVGRVEKDDTPDGEDALPFLNSKYVRMASLADLSRAEANLGLGSGNIGITMQS